MSVTVLRRGDDKREFLCVVFYDVEADKLEIEPLEHRDTREVMTVLEKFFTVKGSAQFHGAGEKP